VRSSLAIGLAAQSVLTFVVLFVDVSLTSHSHPSRSSDVLRVTSTRCRCSSTVGWNTAGRGKRATSAARTRIDGQRTATTSIDICAHLFDWPRNAKREDERQRTQHSFGTDQPAERFVNARHSLGIADEVGDLWSTASLSICIRASFAVDVNATL
jgi:hypothetical protein